MAIEFDETFAAIGSEDFGRALAFYSAILGREPDERLGDGYAAFRLPGLRLGIFRPKRGGAADFANPPGRRAGLNLVFRVASLDRALAEVEGAGGSATSAFATSHGREAYAYDPDGNRLILVESTPRP
ncbi:VOC family protein [Paludisphaera soli]|uniref:VOC family protein n=1 Tax=Paludisphaera soli TaxID=2712865 RepID=UPI0013EDD88A|nr:VOC family protein [Paludisphaera soli]